MGRISVLFTCIFLGFSLFPTMRAEAGVADADLARWNVTLDMSSLETILLDPEQVLADPDEFWKTDAGYQLSMKWHKSAGVSLDDRDYYDNWLAGLQELVAVPKKERRSNRAFEIVEELKDRVPVFDERSIPLLNGFVPDNGMKFETTIHFTTRTYAFGFMTHGQIVCDPLSYYYGENPDKIFNLLTHECFHIGYGYNRYFRLENELDNRFIYHTMLDALQNEGMATYVGYSARDFFPVEDEKDYLLLDDPEVVREKLAAVNALFAGAEEAQPDSLKGMSWEVGVVQRAYYVTGAHMARTIDRELGRAALVQTVAMGPLDFVDVYNGLAADGMKVKTFRKPDPPLLLTELKTAAVHQDRTAFDETARQMEARKDELHPKTQARIEKLGYGMIYLEAFEWAIALFEVDVALFPESANSYDCLAEAYWKSGDRENAILFYQEALKIDPQFKNAEKMLAEIQG